MTEFRGAVLAAAAAPAGHADALPPALAPMVVQAGLMEGIVAVDRMIASLEAAKLRLVHTAHEVQVEAATHALVEREFRAEIATALRISERGAERLLDEATVLARYLPATLDALSHGRVTKQQARVLVDELGLVDETERVDLESRALAAADRSATAFTRLVRRMRETRTPETAAARHQRAYSERSVRVEAGRDGMAWLTAHLPAAEAIALDSRLDDLARGLHRDGDRRTITQLRADALVDVLLDRDPRTLRRFGDSRPTVIVTVPLDTLTGGTRPAHLTGYGPLDPQTAREIAGDAAVLHRMFTDPRDDTFLGLGRTRYRVTENLRLYLTARDDHCRFPGCHRPPTATDLDHTTDWARGGTTDPTNLTHLCRNHHRLKHHTRWRIEATHPDGTVDWVSPTGRRHQTHPARRATPPGPPEPGLDPPALDPPAGGADAPHGAVAPSVTRSG